MQFYFAAGNCDSLARNALVPDSGPFAQLVKDGP
jgi:hypothetical protein